MTRVAIMDRYSACAAGGKPNLPSIAERHRAQGEVNYNYGASTRHNQSQLTVLQVL
jgi:hypothetical protein